MNEELALRPRLSYCQSRKEAVVYRPTSKPRLSPLFCLTLAVSLALLSGCRSIAPPTPLDQLNAQQREGYDVFQTRCAACHYERTDQPKNGPTLVGLYKKPYLHSGAPANDDRVTATVLHGHGLMPAQPNLDPDALNALLAYLHTV